MKKILCLLIIVTTWTVLITGCEGNPRKDKENIINLPVFNEKETISVLVPDQYDFMSTFGIYINEISNLDLTFIETRNLTPEEIQTLIDEKKPDIIYSETFSDYQSLANAGKLYDLAGNIKKDQFNIQDMNPPVIESLKMNNKGKLYGLAVKYIPDLLFYNKDLFEQYDIPFPKDDMTWEEVVNLAKKFPSDKITYGLYEESPYDFINKIGSARGLSILNSAGDKIAISNTEVSNVFKYVFDLYKSNVAYKPSALMEKNAGDEQGFTLMNFFVIGKAAMTTGSLRMINTINNAKELIKNAAIVDHWDVVTAPDGSVSPRQIFSIQAQSSNREAAWKVIQYLNDRKLDYTDNLFPVRMSFMPEIKGRNMNAFTRLKPSNMNTMLKELPVLVFVEMDNDMKEEADEVIQGNKTTDDAITSIEEKAQEALTTARIQEKQKAQQ